MRHAIPIALAVIVASVSLADAQSPAGRAAARTPRIPAPAESGWTAEQRQLLAEFSSGRATNDLRTLLVHPDLVRGVMPFTRYLASGSSLPARDRALLMLRTAWLARSEYLWAKHAADAERAGLSPSELARVASGVRGAEWPPFEAALLRAADELHAASFIGDATWKALAARYDTRQLIDAVFTIAETTMRAGLVNSVRIPIDEHLTARMPAGERIVAASRTHVPLTAPRIPPLDPAAWTPEVRAMLDPSGSGRPVAAVYRTFAQHPGLYPPRQLLSEYIRRRNTLAPRLREIVILRIGYLCGSEYEWAAHARAGRAAGLTAEEIVRLARDPRAPEPYGGWKDPDALLVRAVDELYDHDTMSDATWKGLEAFLDRRQLLDLLITAGGYRMVSMALNTFGVPLEPGGERFPPGAERR